jgi:hypothetical protein
MGVSRVSVVVSKCEWHRGDCSPASSFLCGIRNEEILSLSWCRHRCDAALRAFLVWLWI